jgi:predicted transcriptional regulator
MDWLAAGLPVEGKQAGEPRAGNRARADLPTCRLDEQLGPIRERICAAGWDRCAVVNEDRLVLGLLRARELDGIPTAVAEAVMDADPRTVRTQTSLGAARRELDDAGLDGMLVTTSDGRLLGWLRRDEAAAPA